MQVTILFLRSFQATCSSATFLSLVLNGQFFGCFVFAMDKSTALRDGGKPMTISLTLDRAQYMDKTTTLTQDRILKPRLNLTSEVSPSPTIQPTRPLLNSCIIVLTVTSFMIVNVRVFVVCFPQQPDFPFSGGEHGINV